MSQLKTYRSPTPIVPWETRRYDGPMVPGDWVTHHDCGGQGIIIAINTEEMLVLWSRAPRSPIDTLFSPGYVYTMLRRLLDMTAVTALNC